jgi:hypothetical protein
MKRLACIFAAIVFLFTMSFSNLGTAQAQGSPQQHSYQKKHHKKSSHKKHHKKHKKHSKKHKKHTQKHPTT